MSDFNQSSDNEQEWRPTDAAMEEGGATFQVRDVGIEGTRDVEGTELDIEAQGSGPGVREASKEAAGKVAGAVTSAAGDVAQTLRAEAATIAQSLGETAKSAASQVASAAKDQAKAKGEQVTDEAALRAHLAKQTAADKLHEAADKVRQRSTLPEAEVFNKAADRIDKAADYVREHDYPEMKSDFETRVQESPMMAVALALLVGFLLGSLLKRG